MAGTERSIAVDTRVGQLRVRVMGAGPVAVLWHSLFVDSSTWQRLQATLARHRRLLLIDGPGHGNNPPPPGTFTMDDCAAAACTVLDQLGGQEPVDWVGNAWGGHVGTVFAANNAWRCRSLVSIAAPVHALPPDQRRGISAAVVAYRLLGPVKPLVKVVVDGLLGKDSDPGAAALVADAFRRAQRRGMATAIRSASLNRDDASAALAAVEAPTLLVAGADDKLWPPAMAQAAGRHLQHGAIVTVPGAGHVAPLLMAAPTVAELLTEFWADPAETVRRHALKPTASTPPPS